jgi:hypothetical protein
MNNIIKKDILSVLRNSLKAIRNNDLIELRNQSDRTIHNSSTFQDKYSITTAVVIYSMYKILEKNKFRVYPGWKSFDKFLILELKKSILFVNDDNFTKYLDSLKKITRSMTKLDKNVGLFVDHVIHVTKIKKATRIHEHGISTSRVSDLLGIPTWEVMSYLGHTKSFDTSLNKSKSTIDRLNLAKRIFNLK